MTVDRLPYRRYLKNGASLDFEHYLDLDSNQPRICATGSLYGHDRSHRATFNSRPLVLFHEDLQTDPFALIAQLCAFTGAHYQRDQVNLSIVHSSWSDKQLKLARLAGKRLFDPVPGAATNPTLHRVRRRLHLWTCYGILGIAQMVPAKWVNPDPLINQKAYRGCVRFLRTTGCAVTTTPRRTIHQSLASGRKQTRLFNPIKNELHGKCGQQYAKNPANHVHSGNTE
jgi:hypothetical protein